MRPFIVRNLVAGTAFLCVGTAHAASALACDASSVKSGQSYRVAGSDIELRATPSPQGERLINEKASAIFKKTHYMVIDHSTVVTEECSKAGWSRVRVTEPEWLSATHIGWVPSNVLQGKTSDPSGAQVFTEANFLWDKKITPYKQIIIAGVNKVHRENERCKDIDPHSAYLSSSKGSAKDPVFYVTCGKGAQAFNAYFSKSDVEKDAVLVAAKHINTSQAINLCEGYAKSNANHPSTVRFSRLRDLDVSEHPNGRTSVTSTFTAKNSFNLELKFNIRCLLDSTGLIEANVSEKAN